MKPQSPPDVTNGPATPNGDSVQQDCWAARLKELKHRQTEDRLRRCDEMLTMAGVPEWVMNSKNDGVPANSTPDRLLWYLARRKDIKPGEVDQKLQREMREWLSYVARPNKDSAT